MQKKKLIIIITIMMMMMKIHPTFFFFFWRGMGCEGSGVAAAIHASPAGSGGRGSGDGGSAAALEVPTCVRGGPRTPLRGHREPHAERSGAGGGRGERLLPTPPVRDGFAGARRALNKNKLVLLSRRV